MDIDKNKSKLHELIVRGIDYREDYEFELYGEEVTGIIRPLADEDFLPLVAVLADKLDLDEEAADAEAVEEAREQIDEADEPEDIDVSEMDDEFVRVMQTAAVLGLTGTYDEDGEEVAISDEEAEALVNGMIGGASVELGARVLELSGNARDAEKFRGGRGRVSSTGAE